MKEYIRARLKEKNKKRREQDERISGVKRKVKKRGMVPKGTKKEQVEVMRTKERVKRA